MQSKGKQTGTRELCQGAMEAFLAMSWGERLRLVHLLISVGAMLQAGGEGWMIVLLLVVNLLCAWTRFMRCGIYIRLERLWSLETDNINTKNDCSMETKTMDAEMMRGLFSGANFSGEVQIVVAPKGKVVFNEAVRDGELDDRQILFITHEEQRLWAERFVAFLREHKMMDENGLTKDRDSYINRALACFMDEWQTMGLLREKYLGKALAEIGYTPSQRILTLRQMKVIENYLGEP